MNEGRIEAHKLIWNQHSGETYLLPSLTHRGFVFTPFHQSWTGDVLLGHIHLRRFWKVLTRALIDHRVMSLCRQCHLLASEKCRFYKRDGDFEQHMYEIKRWRRREGEGGLCKISADDIETEVMSYKSSMNWNVTISVGVISHSLQGLTLILKSLKRATQGRPIWLYW